MTQTLSEKLAVGDYTASDKFRAIDRHTCVCTFEGANLIAVTGPADDREAIDYACLFAASPEMLEVCEELCNTVSENGELNFRTADLSLKAIRELASIIVASVKSHTAV